MLSHNNYRLNSTTASLDDYLCHISVVIRFDISEYFILIRFLSNHQLSGTSFGDKLYQTAVIWSILVLSPLF